jgi:hypothetical protein
MVRREQLWGVSRGKEPWRVPLEEEKVTLDLFCAKNNVGFRSFEHGLKRIGELTHERTGRQSEPTVLSCSTPRFD